MPQKSRWLSDKVCLAKPIESNISWSTSDSECEETKPDPTKKKSASKMWIKLLTPTKELHSFKEIVCCPSSPCDNFFQSPLINKVNSEERSPALTQNKESPVISRRKIVKKIKRRCRFENEKKSAHIQEDVSNSPEFFISQTTVVSLKATEIEESPPYAIDPFPSQHSSEVATSPASLTLYHQPPPKRKKFKKGGLASQLQKIVEVHNTSLAIWEHEVFLSRAKGEEMPPCLDGGVECEFCIISKWREFSCVILECRCKSSDDYVKVFSQADCQDPFLVVIGHNNVSGVEYEPGVCCKLFPPYSVKVAQHNHKPIFCIVNASKFVLT